MDCNQTADCPASCSLLAAAIERGKTGDEPDDFARAIDLLRRRHRQRPDIRAKLTQLAADRAGRAAR